jgi:hypothetical protein
MLGPIVSRLKDYAGRSRNNITLEEIQEGLARILLCLQPESSSEPQPPMSSLLVGKAVVAVPSSPATIESSHTPNEAADSAPLVLNNCPAATVEPKIQPRSNVNPFKIHQGAQSQPASTKASSNLSTHWQEQQQTRQNEAHGQPAPVTASLNLTVQPQQLRKSHEQQHQVQSASVTPRSSLPIHPQEQRGHIESPSTIGYLNLSIRAQCQEAQNQLASSTALSDLSQPGQSQTALTTVSSNLNIQAQQRGAQSQISLAEASPNFSIQHEHFNQSHSPHFSHNYPPVMSLPADSERLEQNVSMYSHLGHDDWPSSLVGDAATEPLLQYDPLLHQSAAPSNVVYTPQDQATDQAPQYGQLNFDNYQWD